MGAKKIIAQKESMDSQRKQVVTREAWLLKAIGILLDEKFLPLGAKFNNIRVSVGFPDTKKAIGQWWAPKTTEDNYSSIFIHPGKGDPVEILGILVHELVHDSVGVEAGHGPIFKKLALALGLEGKMRSTTIGKDLEIYLKKLSVRLGPFRHSAIKKNAKPPTPKQTTRMVKMECKDCGYICRASMSKIIENGPVLCPCNTHAMAVEVPEE